MSEPLVLQVPTLNDKPEDFDLLFALWRKSLDHGKDVLFDFSRCQFLRPNAVAFVGGLARMLESLGRKVEFDWDSLHSDWVKNTLKQNGFANAFGDSSCSWTGETIPYREDTSEDTNGFLDYLTNHWLGRGWLQVSTRLRDAIAGKVWEVYANAFEHSQSETGVFSCGTHMKTHKVLILSVADFGQGIAANVRNYLRSDARAAQLTSASCLKWAFQEGTTTKPNGIRRGIGLELLKDFVRLNHGTLEAYSNDGYARIDDSEERYVNRETGFRGTIFHITLRCDEKYYHFADEAEVNWPF